jgi:peptide subunit release factor 1 (eRF1)
VEYGSRDGRAPADTIEHAARGSARDRFNDFVDEHVAQLYRKVAEQAPALMAKHKVRRLVLAGNENSARAVQKLVPEAIASQVVVVKAVPMRYSPYEVLQEVQADALAFERQEEVQLVTQVIDFAKSGGRGALGWKAVREALEMQRVELLILPWPVPDDSQATELILKTFASGGKIELVHGEAAAAVGGEGGVAVRLYYAL